MQLSLYRTYVRSLAGVLVAAILLAPAGLAAQPSLHDVACDRAWLGSDWPSVVAECGAVADRMEGDHKTYLADSFRVPADMESSELEISWASLLFAGQERARIAVAYSMLKRPSLFAKSRALAHDYVTAAQAFYAISTNDTLRNKADMTLRLIDSATFVRDAPDSDVLSQI